MRHRHRRSRLAFTLIEMIVAFSIVVLILGILLVALRAVRRSQTSAACLSNLRQLLQATVSYANDHNGYGPDEASMYTWDVLLQPYVGPSESVYTCPRDADADRFGNSYQMRDMLSVDAANPTLSFVGKKFMDAGPGEVVIFFESVAGRHHEGARNAVNLDGAAGSYDAAAFEANMKLPVVY